MKHKKNLKGFTLAEMLIAMTVFAIMSLMMVAVFSSVCYMNIKNHKANVAMQTQGDEIEGTGTLPTDPLPDPQKITFSSGGINVDVNLHVEKAGTSTDEYKFTYIKPAP